MLPPTAFAEVLQMHCAGDVAIDGSFDTTALSMQLTVVRGSVTDVVQTGILSQSLTSYLDVTTNPYVQYDGIFWVRSEESQSSLYVYKQTIDIYFADFRKNGLENIHNGDSSKVFYVTSYDIPDFDRGAYQVDNVNCRFSLL
jgi:hypothetical protein